MQRILLVLSLLIFMRDVGWGQNAESEGLRSVEAHRSSAWFAELQSNAPNAHRLRLQFEADPSVQRGARSLEWKAATQWLQKHWYLADRTGRVQTKGTDRVAVRQIMERGKRQPDAQNTAMWSCLGPKTWDRTAKAATGSMGIGVVRCVDIHPSNDSAVLVGTISAGIWRSTDAGRSWHNVTDPWPVTTVWDLAIAPSDASLVYAATTIGVLRSVDGGISFERTALSDPESFPNSTPAFALAVDPANPFTVIVAMKGALQRTTDGGVTWETIAGSNGSYWDLAWHPTDRSVVYAVQDSKTWAPFVRSTDGGRSFTSNAVGLPSNPNEGSLARGRIAVSPKKPSMVWVLYGGTADTVSGVWGLYRSRDAGATFDYICCGETTGPEPADEIKNPNLFDYDVAGNGLGQIAWDMAFAVSDSDTSLMVAAGVLPYVSTNGGRVWTKTAAIHYDIQDAKILGDQLWLTHDGGIHTSVDLGATMTDRSDGISALQVWGFGQSHRNQVMAIGAYHMPTILRDDAVYSPGNYVGGWFGWSGADAMSADVNPDDDRWIYAKPWTSVRAERTVLKEVLPRSRDLGIDLGYLSMANLSFHPHLTYSMLAADHRSKAVLRTTTNAEAWDTLRVFSRWVSRVRYAPQQPEFMTAIGDDDLWYSTDDGTTWMNISPPTELSSTAAMSDVIFGESPSELWVSFGGRQSDVKVLHTLDAGTTWEDVSKGLPALAVRCLSLHRAPGGSVFAGTELGVYQLKARSRAWERYGEGLPVAMASFLNVDAVNGVINAGTERGVWQAPLPTGGLRASISRDRDTLRCYRTPVQFYDRSDAVETVSLDRRWSFPGGTPEFSSSTSVAVRYGAPGVYSATLVLGEGTETDTFILEDAVVVLPSECDNADSIPGFALDLTSDEDLARLGRIDTTVSNFTFMAWVKPSGSQAPYSAIFCTDGLGNESVGGLHFLDTNNSVGYLWPNGRWWWNSGLQLPSNKWSHVALVITPDSAMVIVNGVAHIDTIELPAFDLRGRDLVLGTFLEWANRNANIQIDEVRFYGRSLSSDEVRLSMHHPIETNSAGLLAWYQMNESGGRVLYDHHFGKPGQMVGGSHRQRSKIPFGPGATQIRQRLGRGWQPFHEVGLDLSLPADVSGRVMCTRIDHQADSLTLDQTSLKAYWLVRGLDSLAPVFNSVRFQLENLISDEDASIRQFTMWTRPLNEHHDRLWSTSESLVGFPPSYDRPSHNVRGWMSATTEPWRQFALSVLGGPVSVPERRRDASPSLAPVPARDVLRVEAKNTTPVVVTLLNLYGQPVLDPVLLPVEGSLTMDLLSVPSGTYILSVGQWRAILPVIH